MTMISGIDRRRMHYGFDTLNLQEVDGKKFLRSESDSDCTLAALCDTPDSRATLAAILRSRMQLP